eukprot:CAMPEP_0183326784 /NCGR_PEP_ID=MMETSP0160_2-20130417/83129_1 /TAXON_ID=2839 ORGANISM="Odontella Sinensis, Strain Grunow 1884" /NCGR_SAMPLE_ID=MMETSP0160_2 /ASSEMBLY_ACC=CAM_ASM_000250 /LENGTH=30 /DNA_ID= /DNA_START= /DNA_END= /DNA_ORIENTATION=
MPLEPKDLIELGCDPGSAGGGAEEFGHIEC